MLIKAMASFLEFIYCNLLTVYRIYQRYVSDSKQLCSNTSKAFHREPQSQPLALPSQDLQEVLWSIQLCYDWFTPIFASFSLLCLLPLDCWLETHTKLPFFHQCIGIQSCSLISQSTLVLLVKICTALTTVLMSFTYISLFKNYNVLNTNIFAFTALSYNCAILVHVKVNKKI